MKKISLFFLIIILSASFLLAETKTVEKMNVGSKEIVNGKTVTILDAAIDGSVKVEVDGKKGVIKYGDYITEINGMKLLITNYTYIDETFVQIKLEMTVDAKCGDGICNTNMSETNESCCTDCGCTFGKCISNVCRLVECEEDKDCEDNDKCTTNTCTAEKECETTNITECKNDDGCCPDVCEHDTDADCEIEPVDECKNDTECDDENACTTDVCEGQPKKCSHSTAEGCDFEGVCHNITERVKNMYCSREGIKQQKENLERCSDNYECLANECHNNLCGKKSNKNIMIGLVIASMTLLILTVVSYYLFKKKSKV